MRSFPDFEETLVEGGLHMRAMRLVGISVLACLVGASAMAQVSVTKPPDVGPYWQPLGLPNGTYVYTSDFVAPSSGSPASLGVWLRLIDGAPPPVRFQVWGTTGGAPNPGAVLATTAAVAHPATDTLTLFTVPVDGVPATLQSGQRYWLVATVVGESGNGSYQVGGHTQNSAYPDNGTFWYSNDSAGIDFDGQNLTPQMAFVVTLGRQAPEPIPATGTVGLVLLLAALAGAGVFVLRRV
jgi:hypothetical protein